MGLWSGSLLCSYLDGRWTWWLGPPGLPRLRPDGSSGESADRLRVAERRREHEREERDERELHGGVTPHGEVGRWWGRGRKESGCGGRVRGARACERWLAFAVPVANSWCSATPRAISRSPAPRTRDRTVRARSRGVPRPHAVCRALRDDASSESRALVCSAVSGVRRFWQQVKSLACFFWCKRWCLGKDNADGRPRRLREDAPSSDVWCAMEIAIGRPWR